MPQRRAVTKETREVFFVGSYGTAQEQAVAVLDLDTTAGDVVQTGGVAGVCAPSFLHFDARQSRLYAVSEVAAGQVVAYAFERSGRRLTELNRCSSGGGEPCFVSRSKTGRWLFVANYQSGSVGLLEVDRDTGGIGDLADVAVHAGRGPVAGRQDGPHVHMVQEDPWTGGVFATDLGSDQWVSYRIERGTLRQLACGPTPRGSGPRHFAFHPNGRVLYVVHELDSSLSVLRRSHPGAPWLEERLLPLLPQGYAGPNLAADVAMSHAQRTLYVSNRGHDSIAVFALASDGTPSAMGHVSAQGQWPRSLAVSRDERFLLVANQRSNEIVLMSIGEDRLPSATGRAWQMTQPACIRSEHS
ncbi:lactonase family protein [Alicyclobacillus sp. ALC3]|uniref:lactonase family protein n=1 Tax=Alicyclobacillus sp. ALC3 TaxID=2796143 RepID=UPI0023784305|nr:lactonase family protein [Alicyclobacillus sp. ALC3]WDL97904.1 lactonase family protein [Alicyclobacillus sp. ALC3]